MEGPDGYVRALVWPHEELSAIACHRGLAREHNPVFGTMPMLLQAETTARTHLDALDLEERSLLEHRIGTPRPLHGRVGNVFPRALPGQLLDKLADVLT